MACHQWRDRTDVPPVLHISPQSLRINMGKLTSLQSPCIFGNCQTDLKLKVEYHQPLGRKPEHQSKDWMLRFRHQPWPIQACSCPLAAHQLPLSFVGSFTAVSGQHNPTHWSSIDKVQGYGRSHIWPRWKHQTQMIHVIQLGHDKHHTDHKFTRGLAPLDQSGTLFLAICYILEQKPVLC